MDRLDAMTLFVSAVDEGSLAAAARRHGRSPAAVTRAITLLEEQAGETLMLRSTRRLALTAAGDRHIAVWRDVLARLGALVPDAAGAALQGEIVITAPELFGRLKVMPLLETFLRDNPHVAARMLMLNRIVNLVGEGVDIAVRIAPLPDSTLSAVKLGQVRTLLCAAPDYLARAGIPAAPNALDRHACIGLNGEADSELWPFGMPGEGGGVRVRSVRVPTRLNVDNMAAAIEAALRGNGLVRAQSYQVAGHIADGRLVRLLADFERPPIPVHLVFPADRARKGAVRAFIDHAAPILKRALQDVETQLA